MVVSRDVPLCACLTSVSHTEPRPPQSPLSHISFSLASHSITRRTRSLRSLYALTPSHDTAQMKRCRCSLTIRCTSRQRHKRLQGIPTTWLSNQTGCLSSGICWCVHVCICAPTLTWRGAILLCAPPCAHPSPHAACTTTVVSVCVRVQYPPTPHLPTFAHSAWMIYVGGEVVWCAVHLHSMVLCGLDAPSYAPSLQSAQPWFRGFQTRDDAHGELA